MRQATLGILKPGVVDRERAVREAQRIAREAHLRIVWWKKVLMTPDLAETLYAPHRGRFFYQRLVLFMAGEEVDVFVFEGEEAVRRWRDAIGPTHRAANEVLPNTLRGMFAKSDTRNAFHGSGSPEEAEHEVALFTPVQSLRQAASMQ